MDENQQLWSLPCPFCGFVRTFTTRQGYHYATNRNSVCNTCSGKRKIFSNEHRKKISQSKIGRKNPMFGKIGFRGQGERNPMFGRVGNRHPFYGRMHSDKSKQKIKLAAKHKMNNEYRYKMSLLLLGKNKGKTRSNETKFKMRISKLKRLEKLGISQKEDRGAKTFFENINKLGYEFKPKRFVNIGYDADGYDENRHIWCEFDTPYHNVLSQQLKDFIRQRNIISHFECIGNPLKAFIRIKSDKDGNVIESRYVYKDGKSHVSPYKLEV